MKTLLIPKKFQHAVIGICGSLMILISAGPPNTPANNLEFDNAIPNFLTSDLLPLDNTFKNTIEISDTFAIIGAPNEDLNFNEEAYLSNAGAANIYQQDPEGNWNNVQKITASDRTSNDLFGWSAAISENYAVVTAPYDANRKCKKTDLKASGSVYIFERNTVGKWVEKQKIDTPEALTNGQFGYSVAISGHFIIVGAYEMEKVNAIKSTTKQSGAAYIFERDENGNWNEVQKIIARDQRQEERFGYSVSIHENYAIVESHIWDNSVSAENKNSDASSAYIFKRFSNGTWTQQQKLINPRQTLHILEKLL